MLDEMYFPTEFSENELEPKTTTGTTGLDALAEAEMETVHDLNAKSQLPPN